MSATGTLRAAAGRVRHRDRRRPEDLARDMAAAPRPLKLNVGAGGKSIEGWFSTDIDLAAPYLLDLLIPWALPPVDYVYADNVLEHFTLPDLRLVLRNAHAGMAPGGQLRVCVPDVEGNARMYLNGGPDADAVMSRHREAGNDVSYPQDMLRVVFSLNDHAEGYPHDQASLTAELTAAGFTDVRRYPVGESEDPNLRGLEARASRADDLLLLTMEARRG